MTYQSSSLVASRTFPSISLTFRTTFLAWDLSDMASPWDAVEQYLVIHALDIVHGDLREGISERFNAVHFASEEEEVNVVGDSRIAVS